MQPRSPMLSGVLPDNELKDGAEGRRNAYELAQWHSRLANEIQNSEKAIQQYFEVRNTLSAAYSLQQLFTKSEEEFKSSESVRALLASQSSRVEVMLELPAYHQEVIQKRNRISQELENSAVSEDKKREWIDQLDKITTALNLEAAVSQINLELNLTLFVGLWTPASSAEEYDQQLQKRYSDYFTDRYGYLLLHWLGKKTEAGEVLRPLDWVAKINSELKVNAKKNLEYLESQFKKIYDCFDSFSDEEKKRFYNLSGFLYELFSSKINVNDFTFEKHQETVDLALHEAMYRLLQPVPEFLQEKHDKNQALVTLSDEQKIDEFIRNNFARVVPAINPPVLTKIDATSYYLENSSVFDELFKRFNFSEIEKQAIQDFSNKITAICREGWQQQVSEDIAHQIVERRAMMRAFAASVLMGLCRSNKLKTEEVDQLKTIYDVLFKTCEPVETVVTDAFLSRLPEGSAIKFFCKDILLDTFGQALNENKNAISLESCVRANKKLSERYNALVQMVVPTLERRFVVNLPKESLKLAVEKKSNVDPPPPENPGLLKRFIRGVKQFFGWLFCCFSSAQQIEARGGKSETDLDSPLLKRSASIYSSSSTGGVLKRFSSFRQPPSPQDSDVESLLSPRSDIAMSPLPPQHRSDDGDRSDPSETLPPKRTFNQLR